MLGKTPSSLECASGRNDHPETDTDADPHTGSVPRRAAPSRFDDGHDVGGERAGADRRFATNPAAVHLSVAVGIESDDFAALADRKPSDVLAGWRRVAKAD